MIMHQTWNSYGNYNYNAFIYTNVFWESHFHGNYELIYAINGCTNAVINGKSTTLFPGELLLVPPYTVHALNSIDDAETWVGVFSEDYISSFTEAHRFSRFSKFKCNPKAESFLSEFLFFEGQPEHYMHKACLYMVCNECIKNATMELTPQDSLFLSKVTSYISEHLSENITMKSLSDELNYEYHYFSSLFNQCFSINFKTFINIYRYGYACKLLSDKSNKITKIASDCGFGSIVNFNRVFKKFCGCTPSEYRKKL